MTEKGTGDARDMTALQSLIVPVGNTQLIKHFHEGINQDSVEFSENAKGGLQITVKAYGVTGETLADLVERVVKAYWKAKRGDYYVGPPKQTGQEDKGTPD